MFQLLLYQKKNDIKLLEQLKSDFKKLYNGINTDHK